MSDVLQQSLAHIVVGVADMRPVRDLWIERFGMEVVAESCGADAAQAGIWGLAGDAIAEQLLVRTPGVAAGWIHFVRFAESGEPVRSGAAAYDLCPKNIDVNCADMSVRYAELQAAGLRFRSAISDYSIDGLEVREVQVPVHDDINLVLIEVPAYHVRLSPQHYGAVTSFVLAVPDLQTESRFYMEMLGLDLVLEHRAAGPEIEQVVGLPPGAALLLRLLGSDEQIFGRVELIEYERMQGADLYPRARPPALGSLLGRFATDDLAGLIERIRAAGIDVEEHGSAELIFGRCRLASLRTPAGFRLELFELL